MLLDQNLHYNESTNRLPVCTTTSYPMDASSSAAVRNSHSTCVSPGHILFLTDKDKELLVRIHLWPIQHQTYLFQPYYMTDNNAVVLDRYSSILFQQNQAESTISSYFLLNHLPDQGGVIHFPVTTILSKTNKIQNIDIDTNSSILLLSVEEGLLFKLDLDVLLRWRSSPYEVPVTSLLLYNPMNRQNPGMNPKQLPNWIQMIYKSTVDARFRGVAIVPLSETERNNTLDLWSLQRFFVLDVNKEQLIVLNQDTLRNNQVELGFQFNIIWPHQIILRRKIDKTASSNEIIEFYVTEYLGKLNGCDVES